MATFQRAGHNGGIGGPASPIVVTATANSGEQAVVFIAFSFLPAGTQPVPTITGGGTWTRRGTVSLLTGGTQRSSIEVWTNDGTAFTSISVAYTNGPNAVAISALMYTGSNAIGNTTSTTATATLSFAESLVMQEATNTIVMGWNGDDASTPDPFSAGASTNLRDQLAESSANDVNLGIGDRTAVSTGSLTATITVAAAACNAAGCSLELRTTAAGGNKKLTQEDTRGILLESGSYLFQ